MMMKCLNRPMWMLLSCRENMVRRSKTYAYLKWRRLCYTTGKCCIKHTDGKGLINQLCSLPQDEFNLGPSSTEETVTYSINRMVDSPIKYGKMLNLKQTLPQVRRSRNSWGIEQKDGRFKIKQKAVCCVVVIIQKQQKMFATNYRDRNRAIVDESALKRSDQERIAVCTPQQLKQENIAPLKLKSEAAKDW